MPLQDFNTTSNGDNWRLYQGPWPNGHALSQNRSTPDIPSNQRGPGGAYNQLMVDRINIEASGYGTSANARGRLWNSSGTHLARSASISIGSVSTSTINVPLQNFDLESPIILTGGTLYRWGIYSASTAIAVQKVVNSSFNIYSDTSIGASDNWSTGNTNADGGADHSFAGSFRYFLIPTPPSVSSNGSTSSSISFSWSVSDNGGKTISGYDIQYKPNYSGSWEAASSTTSTSATISGLLAGTTYDVRVAAKNEVTALIGTTSEWGQTSIATSGSSFAFSPFSFSPAPSTTTVPNLNGLTVAQAVSAITSANLNASATAVTAGATPENNNTVIINSQSPAAGTVVNTGSTVSYQYYQYVAPAQEVSVWNGTSWVASTPKIWNGTSWVNPTAIKVWNGTSWVNPT